MGIVNLNRGIRRTQKINDKIKFEQLVLILVLFIMLSGLVCAPSPECFCNSDLTVILKPTSVSFNPVNTTINQTVSVNAVVKNLNNKSANSTIEFKLNNVSIENKTISASGFSSQTVTFNFTRTPENHTIKIIADPANEVNESEEGNNYGEIKLYNYSECGNDVCEYPENGGSCPEDCSRYYCSRVDDCAYENLENPGCSCGEYVNYRFREPGNDWGTATMISVCFLFCSPSIPACVNHECTARDYSLNINKTISEAEVKPGGMVTFTLLVENMGPNKVYGVHVADYLLQGFNYVNGSLNVYYCNKTDNFTGECINYEECQHSGTGEYDCLSDDSPYFWFDAFAVGNNTLILGEFQYINGGYAYENIENNTLLWTERYMIRFNVSVGENVTRGNYTNTANVSGYLDFGRNFPIDYPDDSLEGCLTQNNYNETSGSCINSSITDDNDRTSSVIFIVLPEPEIDLTPKTLSITQNQNQATANVTAAVNNSGNVSVNNVKIELRVDGNSIENKTVNLSVNSETNVTFSWNATGGTHTITVKVDPDNLIDELNETNNEITASMFVMSEDYCEYDWECVQKFQTCFCGNVEFVNWEYYVPPEPCPECNVPACILVEARGVCINNACGMGYCAQGILSGGPYLRINKTISSTTVKQEGSVTFTLLIINTGKYPAYNVSAADYLPSGFTYLNNSEVVRHYDTDNREYKLLNRSGYNFNYFNNTVSWNFNYMHGIPPADYNAVDYFNFIKIQFNVSIGENVTPGNHTNTANVSGYLDEQHIYPINYNENDAWEGCGTYNNYNETSGSCINSSITDDLDRTSSVTFTVLSGLNLTLSKESLTGFGYPGYTLMYRITVTNNGNLAVENVTINDVSHFNQTAGPYPIEGDCVGGSVICLDGSCSGKNETFIITMANGTGGVMLPGQSCIFEYESLIPNDTSDGMYVNIAAVKVKDYKIAEDESYVSVPCCSPEIIAQKTANTTAAYVGDYVNFTINLRASRGSINVTDVYVTDLMPSGWEYVSSGGMELINCTGRICDFKLNNNLTNNLTTVWIETRIGENASTVFTRNKIEIRGNTTDGLSAYFLAFSNTVNVWRKPDFTVTNLTVPDMAVEGDNITISALIRNSGNINLNLSRVNVSLFVDGSLIESKILDLTGITEFYFNFTYRNASAGVRNITVAVDPDNLIDESNEYNNNLTAGIEVMSCVCSSCGECEEKLNNPVCLVVALTANITSHQGTCIDNPGNFTGKIFDCMGNTIGGDSSGVDYGIYLDVKSGNTIKNCEVRNFYYGIRLFSLSENSILENNDVSLNNYGILLTYFSNNNTLINNTVNSNGEAGVFLAYCSGNKIMNNTVNSNGYSGIHIEHSGGNILESNTADNNLEHGIYFATGDSSGNLMNLNRFCSNGQKSISTGYTYYDIYNAGLNQGDDNTCDSAHGWSDDSFPLRNCTYLCTVPGKPDFAAFNLTYSPEYGNETMNVTVRAGAINLGNTSFAGEVNVSLLVDDVYGSSKILNLTGATKFYVNLTYENAVKKEHNVTLFIDYGNVVDEFNENNNFLKTQVPAESPKLAVIKSMSQHDVEKGSEPLITIIIMNPTYVPVYNLTVTDFMPPGFNYVNGTGRLNEIPIPDPYVTNPNLTLVWNTSIVSGLSEIPAKTIMVLTFRSKVESGFEYNFEFINGTVNVKNVDEFPIYFNNTVNVSGAGGSGEIVRNGTQYELRVYPNLDRAVLFKFASKSNASCYEYIEYTIVIWNRDEYYSLFPSVLEDELPPYLEYVPGHNYVNNTQIADNLSTGNLNLTEIPGFTYTNDYTSGQTLVWNLSGMIYLAPGQQAAIKYRVRVIPGINDTAIDTIFLSYSDTQGVCGDCYAVINTTRAIYPACSIKPDFRITNLHIPESSIEGGNVTIFALIRNLHNINLNLSGVNVSLLVDGNLTDSMILNLTNISEFNVTLKWVAVFGVHNLRVIVDPNNEVDENNEWNNEMWGAVNAEVLVTKTASKSNVSCYDYVDYTIVIRNILSGANVTPLVMSDILPPYLKYVPDYAYIGDLNIEPSVCGDYRDETTGAIMNIQNGTEQGNCSDFNNDSFQGYNPLHWFNGTETANDGIGEILFWNLSKYVFLTPGQQIIIKYRVRVIPGIENISTNTTLLGYLDPEHCNLFPDCYFEMNTTLKIYPKCSIKPDFRITNLHIPESSIEGGNITISALIRNLHNINLNLSGVNVSLLVDGNLTDSMILNLTNISQFLVNFNYGNASLGVHNILVIIDPDDEIDELDESNNFVEIEIIVPIPGLEVIKSMSQRDVEPGSEPITTIIIQNPTYAPVYNLTVTDFLPMGFNYTNGSAMLNGIPIPDPYIKNSSEQSIRMNLTWNSSIVSSLSEIHTKTVMVLTFRTKVVAAFEYNVEFVNGTVKFTGTGEYPLFFNNTVNVSGVSGTGEIVGPESADYEMRGYIIGPELFKFASKYSASCYEYINYTIVIWNDPMGASIAPLTLKDTLPPYLKYVPGYASVGELKLEPTVCGDYRDERNGSMINVQTGTGQGNCSGFHDYFDYENNFNGYNETAGDGVGETLLWNLSRWLFLTPGQQVAIKYRVQVIPGISGAATNNALLGYLDPEHPDMVDFYFEMDTSQTIGSTCSINPDFTVTNLTLPGASAKGEDITISALIRNSQNINLNLSGVNVSLFVDDTYKNSVILNLTNITGETVNFTWIAAPGTYALTIKIDPGGEIEEFNESNNELSINLSVMQRETVNSQRSGSSGGSGMIAFKQMCWNSLCEENETCENCPVDCGNCPVKINPEIAFNESGREPAKTACPLMCDDGNKCTTDQCFGETNYECVHRQIIPCCGDYVCEKEESCFSCRDDCGECELKINCTKAAVTGEVVECRVTDVENNSMPNVTVRIVAGVDVSIAVTDENGMINFTANVGAAEVTFEKNGYSPVKIDIFVTSKDEKKSVFDSVTENKFLLLSGFALMLFLLFRLFGKRKGMTAPESVRDK